MLNALGVCSWRDWSSGDNARINKCGAERNLCYCEQFRCGCTVAASVHVTVTLLPIIDLPSDNHSMFENNPTACS
ncbi:MAG: hypothetical protein M9931_05295 [Chitinophagales bacterium]|nr:hypothetical protein [Chitinophagales bacterium]